MLYKVDNYFSKENEVGINWDDKDIGIVWSIENPILSEKDKNNITLKAFTEKYIGIVV